MPFHVFACPSTGRLREATKKLKCILRDCIESYGADDDATQPRKLDVGECFIQRGMQADSADSTGVFPSRPDLLVSLVVRTELLKI